MSHQSQVCVLVIPAGLGHQNLGDVAMLEVAVRRVRSVWPGARIACMAGGLGAAAELRRQCPGVEPLTYSTAWFSDTILLGRLHRWWPARLTAAMAEAKRSLLRWSPSLLERLILLRLGSNSEQQADFRRFLTVLQESDAVIAAGAGGINDHFSSYWKLCLGILEVAQSHGKPTAAFSQGLGPLRDPVARRRLRRVFGRLRRIALREARDGRALLEALGVPSELPVVTGDDAVEIAFEQRKPGLGGGLGINLRIADYAGVDTASGDSLAAVLRAFASEHGTSMIPLPIARSNDQDLTSASRLMGEDLHEIKRRLGPFDTTLRLIQLAGTCRVVVTGAYHAAVFALSQGIPAICLCGSDYYRHKFKGLAVQFGPGCEVVELAGDRPMERLAEVLAATWANADQLRPSLLDHARCQIESSRSAYERFLTGVHPPARPAVC